MKKTLLALLTLCCLGVSALAAPQCKVVDPIRRVDCRKNDDKSCTGAGCCWGPTQTMCGNSPCPWCYKADETKPAPKGNPASCKPVDDLQRVASSGGDVQSCNDGNGCWAPSRVQDFDGHFQPSCYKPTEKTQRCPAVSTPNCHGDIAKGTGQQIVKQTYTYNGASCSRWACQDRPAVKSNVVACQAKAGKDRVDCRKNEMADCQSAHCCWIPTQEKNAKGQIYPWCFQP